MCQIGYTSCKADPDLWLKVMTRLDSNVHYYTYIICYVDDILCIHHDPMSVMNEINSYLPLKPSSVGNPGIYLGAKLGLGGWFCTEFAEISNPLFDPKKCSDMLNSLT